MCNDGNVEWHFNGFLILLSQCRHPENKSFSLFFRDLTEFNQTWKMISTNFPPTTSDPTQEILAQRKQECEKLLHDTKSQYEEGKGFYFFSFSIFYNQF